MLVQRLWRHSVNRLPPSLWEKVDLTQHFILVLMTLLYPDKSDWGLWIVNYGTEGILMFLFEIG